MTSMNPALNSLTWDVCFSSVNSNFWWSVYLVFVVCFFLFLQKLLNVFWLLPPLPLWRDVSECCKRLPWGLSPQHVCQIKCNSQLWSQVHFFFSSWQVHKVSFSASLVSCLWNDRRADLTGSGEDSVIHKKCLEPCLNTSGTQCQFYDQPWNLPLWGIWV